MKVSNRVKRNISFTLFIVGIACVACRVWELVLDPSSGRAWWNVIGMAILTYFTFDSFMTYRRRVKNHILFGSK